MGKKKNKSNKAPAGPCMVGMTINHVKPKNKRQSEPVNPKKPRSASPRASQQGEPAPSASQQGGLAPSASGSTTNVEIQSCGDDSGFDAPQLNSDSPNQTVQQQDGIKCYSDNSTADQMYKLQLSEIDETSQGTKPQMGNENNWDEQNYDDVEFKSDAEPNVGPTGKPQQLNPEAAGWGPIEWSNNNSSKSFREDDRHHQHVKKSDFNKFSSSESQWPSHRSDRYSDREDDWRHQHAKKSDFNKFSSSESQRSSRRSDRYSEPNNYRGKNSDKINDEYEKFDKIYKETKEYDCHKVKEQFGDLFEMGKEYALAHCVAEDMNMGSGIAVQFRKDFKRVGDLLDQRQSQGGLAVLEIDNRYIYYLVTKRESSGKPTYEKFFESCKKWRDHVRDNNVKRIAIPRIGCGLDRLEWDKVKFMLEYLFKDVDCEITVCNFQQGEDDQVAPAKIKNCKVVHETYPIVDIAQKTIILYLCSEDGHVTKEMEQLDNKFRFLDHFKRQNKVLGQCIRFDRTKNYILYGCTVRKGKNDDFQFGAFEKCLREVQKKNNNDKYYYVGIQAVDSRDQLLNLKIINLLRNLMRNVEIYVCWPGELESQIPDKNRNY